MDLESAVRSAAAGDLDGFTEITRRTQHMAFGYALSLVGDLGLAEDVVQEAFVAAWFGLPSLIEPAAFPGWLRGIVRHRAHRELRRRHLEGVPLAAAGTVAASDPGVDQIVERRQEVSALLKAIAQPFFVAEPYTRKPGVTVSRAESLRVCREILDGMHDAVPVDAFYFTGGLDEVLARAAGR